MIKNYFKTALRNLKRNKLFSLINILGLSVGISAALVIFLIVQYDLSFDNFQKDGARIYRIVTQTKYGEATYPNSGVPQPVVPAVSQYITGIDESASFFCGEMFNVKVNATGNTKAITLKDQMDIAIADEHYFQLLPEYRWRAGSPATALRQPRHTVLAESRAKVYFPGMDPTGIVGQVVVYNDSIPCVVDGVVADIEANTDFRFKEFISMPTVQHGDFKTLLNKEWNSINSNYQYFVRLTPGTAPASIEKQLLQLRQRFSTDKEDPQTKITHYLQPLSDLHFNAAYDNFSGRLAHRPTLYGLMLVAVFLLTLACINFINLTTAQGAQRAKEIGIRKTMGGSRRGLIGQFLCEAFVLTLISTALSLTLTPWLLKIFSDFIPDGLRFDLLHRPVILVFLGILIAVVSLLSGSYPAFVLSRYNPILVLKNQAFTGSATTRSTMLRQTLTVTQFVIAQAFIIGTLIVGRQIQYSLNKDMGFRKDAILTFGTPWKAAHKKDKNQVLMQQLKALPGVSMVSLASNPPAATGFMSQSMAYKDGKKEIQADVQIKVCDSNYLKLYGIRLLAGRNVYYGDSVKEMLINETYAHLLGFQRLSDALGKETDAPRRIVGVISDFHYSSLREKIKPLAVTPNGQEMHTFNIALSGNKQNAVASIETAYKTIYPGEDFKYKWLDETVAKMYRSEQKIAGLLRWATGLTIFISCLGLLGLVVYATQLRTKEIGIRKVLGATVTQIVGILSKDFVKLVLIAFLIAAPAAWWATDKWLGSFAYRTPVSWWLFVLSGLAMLGMAVLTLSIQTIRAAIANPVKSLRSE